MAASILYCFWWCTAEDTQAKKYMNSNGGHMGLIWAPYGPHMGPIWAARGSSYTFFAWVTQAQRLSVFQQRIQTRNCHMSCKRPFPKANLATCVVPTKPVLLLMCHHAQPVLRLDPSSWSHKTLRATLRCQNRVSTKGPA